MKKKELIKCIQEMIYDMDTFGEVLPHNLGTAKHLIDYKASSESRKLRLNKKASKTCFHTYIHHYHGNVFMCDDCNTIFIEKQVD